MNSFSLTKAGTLAQEVREGGGPDAAIEKSRDRAICEAYGRGSTITDLTSVTGMARTEILKILR